MRLEQTKPAIAVCLVCALGGPAGSGASPVIGTVMARGTFRIDNATVRGNATLVEGALLETAQTGSEIELRSGARLSLGVGSKGRLYGDRMVLEKGEGSLENGVAYRIEARGLTVQPETLKATGRVSLSGPNRVLVAALSGPFRVLNSRGVLVANLTPGNTLEFEPQQDASGARVTGCVVNHGGRLVVTDETTNVIVEVYGAGVEKEVGNRVEVAGVFDPSATPVSEASQFIRVAKITRLARGCVVRPGAAAAGVGGAAGKSAGGTTTASGGIGASTTTVVAIIGGVAAAATLGGLAAADKLGNDSGTPISR